MCNGNGEWESPADSWINSKHPRAIILFFKSIWGTTSNKSCAKPENFHSVDAQCRSSPCPWCETNVEHEGIQLSARRQGTQSVCCHPFWEENLCTFLLSINRVSGIIEQVQKHFSETIFEQTTKHNQQILERRTSFVVICLLEDCFIDCPAWGWFYVALSCEPSGKTIKYISKCCFKLKRRTS